MRKFAVSTAVVLLLLLAGLLAGQWVQRSLTAAGLEQLDWQQLRWSDGALRVRAINGSYRLDQGRMGFQARQLIVRPVWRGGPRLEKIDVSGLQLVWQPTAEPSSVDSDPLADLPRLGDFRGPLSWLPNQLEIHEMQLQLPCSGEFCTLQGGLVLMAQHAPLDVSVRLGLINEGQTITGWLKIQEQSDSYQVQAGAYVPEPLPLVGVGQLSGSMQLDLQNRGEQWLLREGQMQALLEQPELTALDDLPETLRPDTIALEVTPQPSRVADWQQSIGLVAKMQLTGALSGELTAALALSKDSAWQALLSEGRAQLALTQWRDAELTANELALDLPFVGLIDAQQIELQSADKTVVRLGSLALSELDLRVTDLRAELASMGLKLVFSDQEAVQFDAPLQLKVGRIEHPLLKPQSWELDGVLRQAGTGIKLRSQIEARSGLAANLEFNWPSTGPWHADVALQEIFLRAASPLSNTFVDWPDLLTFSSGRLTGQLQASGSPGLDRLTGGLSLTGGEGIYDRSSFSGLNLPLSVTLQSDYLTLKTDALTLQTLDPGLPLGPLRGAGQYRAPMTMLDAGVLSLKSMQLGVLGGQVRVEPAALDLQQVRKTVIAVVEGVELTRLFEVYPAEGLSGQGTLDGRFPVTLADGKLLIEAGQLHARQPGGVLRYRDERLQELAATNPNMQQLASALEDFHYRVLASDVSYDEQGTLFLGLRLEGSNPDFQGGRQVNLNINLEEDIPALLTSLQLSGQVSDIIKERVQQHYLQQGKP